MSQSNARIYYEINAAAMRPVRNSMPDLLKGFAGLHKAAVTAGALTAAQKELIALAIGLAVRCENCIYTHTRSAVEAGATRAQVLEAAGVAVLMAGGPSYTYLPRVTEALDALEELGVGPKAPPTA